MLTGDVFKVGYDDVYGLIIELSWNVELYPVFANIHFLVQISPYSLNEAPFDRGTFFWHIFF